MEVDYPCVGIASHDVVDIPAQAIQAPTPVRLLVDDVQAVPNYHLAVLTGVATGQEITVRVNPDQVQVLPPERPSGACGVVTQLVGVQPRPGEQVQISRTAFVDTEPRWFLVDEVFPDANDDRWAVLVGRWLLGDCWTSPAMEPVGVFVPGLVVRRCTAA
jgi:hypothetical protein